MKDFDWTADAVAELVKDWPEEAKPKGVTRREFDGEEAWVIGSLWAEAQHAAALHVASGLEWLAARHNWPTELVRPSKNDAENAWLVGWATTYSEVRRGEMTVKGRGPTLLHAISAAIREVAK